MNDRISEWSWESAHDVAEIHALVCASDAHVATPEALAPERSLLSTEWLIGQGATQVLRCAGRAAASFNLLWTPTFDERHATFPPCAKPAYLARLAVDPAWIGRGPLIAAQCIRRAIELASAGGADVLRSETNPDLIKTRKLLGSFGFVEHGGLVDADGRRRVYLQLSLPQAISAPDAS